MDTQDKLPDNGMQSGFMEKLSNYWYHYKWHTLVGGFILIFLIVCIVQCSTRVTPDAYVLYAGPKAMSSDEVTDMQDALNRILDKDLNGDGKIQVDYAEYSLQPEAGAMQQTVVKQLDMEVMSGECIIYFLSPALFEQYFAEGVFMPVKDALGYDPSSSVMNDGFSIKLKELDAYDNFNGIGDLPPDTLIAVKNKAIITTRLSEEEKDKMYSDNMVFLKNLLDYRIPAQ